MPPRMLAGDLRVMRPEVAAATCRQSDPTNPIFAPTFAGKPLLGAA
jgi:hypothetical protein